MQNFSSGRENLSILIVDDIHINCELLVFFLNEIAHLDIAYDGASAVKKTATNNYHLILLDISLGRGMDGFDVLSEIRKQEHNKNIPIIAVTGSATELDRADFLEKGFTEFLAKPVSKKDLLTAIEQVLLKPDSDIQ